VRGGLVTSVVLHAALLAWALFTIQAQRELRMPDQEPIAVDIINASDLTRLRQGARNAKQLEAQAKEAPKAEPAKKEAPKPTPVAAAPPPPPLPEPPPPPKEEPKEEPKKEVAALPPPPPVPAPPPPAAVPPVPAPEEQKKLDELLKEQERQAEERKKLEEQKKAEEQKQLEDQKRLEEESKQAEIKKKLDEAKRRREAELKKKREEEKKRKEAEAKKKQFDAEKIAALLNKAPDKGSPPPSFEPSEPTKAKGPVLGAPEGRDRQLSASEIAVLQQIIRSCVQSKWNLLGGAQGAESIKIKMRLQFKPDGTLAAAPQITNPQNTAYFLAASEGALRAAQACEPYNLPPAKYDVWRDVILTFDPRDMF
jgi:colicin import membrane protein